MKPVPSLLSLMGVHLLVFIIVSVFSVQLSSGVSVTSSSASTYHQVGNKEWDSHTLSSLRNLTVSYHHNRVKRQLIAYTRIDAGGILPVLANRRRGHRGGKRRSAVGEDGTDGRLFKSAGVGYEHQHNNRCEESKCGYNIRHCPHGCVFNSFQCGGGAAYDTCCC